VRIADAQSGVATGALSISFGDGTTVTRHARARHRYRRGGSYTLVIKVRDALGNSAVIRRVVKVS
jgi:hypothetical protein